LRAEDGEEEAHVVFDLDLPDGGGDLDVSGLAEEPDGEVASVAITRGPGPVLTLEASSRYYLPAAATHDTTAVIGEKLMAGDVPCDQEDLAGQGNRSLM
jgi:hypothetical protein